MTTEERLNYLEQRQKIVEEELAYMHKDLVNLINIVENCEPEIHYHFYCDYRQCADCKQQDLKDFI